jgi:hypothetical protein
LIFVTQDNSPGSSLLVLKERSEMNQTFTIEDNETEMLAGVPASLSPRPRRREPVIQVFSQRPAAAHSAEADAIESDGESSFVSIGSIAVRLLAEWSLPRMQMLARDSEG